MFYDPRKLQESLEETRRYKDYIRTTKAPVDIVDELVNYVMVKHVEKRNFEVELEDIISNIMSNPELCEDPQLLKILSDVKELEAGKNKDAMEIHQEVFLYFLALSGKFISKLKDFK